MKKIIYSTALICTLALGACNQAEDYSPQEILNQAMLETSDITSYYGEYTLTIDNEGSSTVKQWQKNSKVRIESVEETGDESFVINDGKTLTMYNKTTNSGSIFTMMEGEMEGYVQPTLQEQAQQMLNLVKNTHTISVGKDEKIAGRDTYHLIAKVKNKNSLIGDIEVWVDKKTWMTLKTVTTSEDMHLTQEYTKFEPNAKIDDTLFIAEVPDDADMVTEQIETPDPITLEEAKGLVGSFLQMPEQNGLTLVSIENMHVEDTKEIALTYLQNGEPAFTLSILKPQEALKISADESAEVRGLPASKTDLEQFKYIQWDEDGLRYGIIFNNPELTFEEVLGLTTQMEKVQ